MISDIDAPSDIAFHVECSSQVPSDFPQHGSFYRKWRITCESCAAEIAEHYADIFAELIHSGQMIPQNDIAVVATARAAGFGILTGPRDEKHFKRVHGLVIRVLRARTR